MLSHLKIYNFALIEDLDIDFERGLNVITGETGAGKSMIIEAINTILGSPSNYHLIKTNADFLEVEALFDLDHLSEKQLKEIEEKSNIVIENRQLIIRRQLHRKKKNRCWINNHLSILSTLQIIGNFLIDLHGQHAHQSLLDPETHIDFVDNLGDHSLIQKKEKLHAYYRRWSAKTKSISQLSKSQSENLSEKDYLTFQLQEIDNTKLKEDEDQLLEKKINIIGHTVNIKEIMEMAANTLYEGGEIETPPLRDILTKVIGHFTSISTLDSKINHIQEQLVEVKFKIEDIADQVIDYKEGIDFDAQQLQELEDRLSAINHLKQKYGTKITDILDYRNNLQQRLNSIKDNQEKIERLKEEKKEDEEKLTQLSLELSNRRHVISKKLEKEIIGELDELNMKNCRFIIRIHHQEGLSGIKVKEKTLKITPQGIDRIEFLISPNAGEKEKPLSDIVSGGEISRIMLAFKSILSKIDQIPTMIFDEIDSGVGARLGEVIANKLVKISKNHQVITITHLPQIAAKANQHLYISKSVKNNKTTVCLKKIVNDEQLDEIARMLDGDQYTSISLQHAREMLYRKELSEDEKKG